MAIASIGVSSSGSARGEVPVSLHDIQSGLGELRTYLRQRDHAAESEAERARLKGCFTDMSQAATRVGQPGLAQAFAVGGQMVATAQAMSAASAVGASAMTCTGAVGAGVLLVSMFTAMDSGEDQVRALQEMMHQYFVQLKTQLAELERIMGRNHAITMHEFKVVHYELSILQKGVSQLATMEKEEFRHIRGDIAIGFNRMTGALDELARRMTYSLAELQMDELKGAEDAIKHYESRGMSSERLLERIAYLERWLESPPGNQLLTGAFYVDSLKRRNYLESSSLAGRIALLSRVDDPERNIASLINLDVFEGILPTYIQALKYYRAAGKVYDADGKMWHEKVVVPLRQTAHAAELLEMGRRTFVSKRYAEMTAAHTQAMEAAKKILHEESVKLSRDVETRRIEEVGQALLNMERPLWAHTRPPVGGATWACWGNCEWLKQCLSERRTQAGAYFSLEKMRVAPLDLSLNDHLSKVNLEGRFAYLTPPDERVYLYPTYLPLEELPLTPVIKEALVAEQRGLGKLVVEAKLIGNVHERAGGLFLYAPTYLQPNCWAGEPFHPKDSFFIHLSWSFVYHDESKKAVLQDDRFFLEYTGHDRAPYGVIGGEELQAVYRHSGGEPAHPYEWNGDSLALTIFDRWLHGRRLHLGGNETFDDARSSLATELGRGGSYGFTSEIVLFPPGENYEKAAHELRAASLLKLQALRRRIFDLSTGNAALKEIFHSQVEKALEAHALLHAMKEHLVGRVAPTPLPLIKEDDLAATRLIPSLPPLEPLPVVDDSAYMRQLKRVQAMLPLWRAEILAVPVPPPPVPSMDGATVADLARRVAALEAAGRAKDQKIDELSAMLEAALRALGVLGS